MTEKEQKFRLQDVIDNLDGTKCIRVKKIVFKAGYFNVTNATEIEWDTHLQGARAERLGEESRVVMLQFIAAWEEETRRGDSRSRAKTRIFAGKITQI